MSMTQKLLKNGCLLILVSVYKIKVKLFFKKGLYHALRLDMLFQTKKNFQILNAPWPRNSGCAFEKVLTEKKRKTFSVFSRKPIFFK